MRVGCWRVCGKSWFSTGNEWFSILPGVSCPGKPTVYTTRPHFYKLRAENFTHPFGYIKFERNRSGTAGFYVDKWKYGDTGKLPDQWKWNEVHPKWRDSIQDGYPELYQVIETTRVVQGEDTALVMTKNLQ